jgi:dienelactone hydrolase
MNPFVNHRIAIAALALVFFCTPGAFAKAAPRFDIQPAPRLVADQPLTIVLDGLPPKTELRVRAERVIHSSFLGNQRRRFRSEAWFVSDAQGRIDLATAVPRRGSYDGADLRGLFWSMTPTADVLQAQDKTGVVHLHVLEGETVLAAADVEIVPAADAVRSEPVPQFPGAVLIKPKTATGKLPVIILLGGAEGGSGAARDHGPRLAALGYAVLGFPYFSPAAQPGGPREVPGLPADFAMIEVGQLNAVRDWLRSRGDVDADRIALFGASKGAEFALLAASHLGWVKAVVAITPSDVVWEGYGWNTEPGTRPSFALDGKPLAFVPYQGFIEEYMRFGAGLPVHLRRPHDQGRAAHPQAAVKARIPVERFKGALLLLAGQDDQLWNSAAMAHNIAERRSEAGLATELLVYSDAGHYLVGDGWSPTAHYNAGLSQSGGTQVGNARAQIDARPRIVAFLRRAL